MKTYIGEGNKMVAKIDLLTAREQIQEDLLCCADGMSEGFKNKICQVVVDRFSDLLEKVEHHR
jgi:hypothetical protein